MPKKWRGENSKAQDARARKAAVLHEEQDKKQRELEDEYWKDDDKHVKKKQQRKGDREQKRLEQLEKKKEAQSLLELEEASLKHVTVKPAPPIKVTRAQIASNREEMEVAATKESVEVPYDERPLEENINRLVDMEGEARSVDDAISVLSVKDPAVDPHPERRVKAAYAAFEQEHLPRVKAENPGMRLSQLKHMIKKDWMKSPENPLNQRLMSQYNS